MFKEKFLLKFKKLLLKYHSKNNLEYREIFRVDKLLYLLRFYLYRKKKYWQPSVYLHCFKSSDEDLELHSHPWSRSLSLILAGSYKEEYLEDGVVKVRILKPGMFNYIKHNKFHRIELLTPEVWTLFVSGKKTKTWGFIDRDTLKFTDWETHTKKKREDEKKD